MHRGIFLFIREIFEIMKNFYRLHPLMNLQNSIESIYSLPVWRSWGWASWSHKWESHISFSKKLNTLICGII